MLSKVLLSPCCGDRAMNIPRNHAWIVEEWHLRQGKLVKLTPAPPHREYNTVELAIETYQPLLDNVAVSRYIEGEDRYDGPADANFIVTGSHTRCTPCRNRLDFRQDTPKPCCYNLATSTTLQFDRSSGYAGYRCQECGAWYYEVEIKAAKERRSS